MTLHFSACDTPCQIKDIIGKKLPNRNVSKSLLINGIVLENKQIAEKFNDFFINVGSNLASKIPESSSKSFKDYLQRAELDMPESQLTLEELKTAFKSLQSNNSADIDDVDVNIVKQVYDITEAPLYFMFNLSLKTGAFPNRFKIARVTPVYKTGDKQVWDLETKTCIHQWNDDDFIPFCVFSPNDEGVAYTSQHYIKLFDIEKELIKWTIECPCEVLSVAFSPDNKYLASAHTDMTARLYDLSNEVFVHQYDGHTSWLTSVSFCQANNNLAISSADGICTVWEVKEDQYNTEKLLQIFDVPFIDKTDTLIAVCSNKNQVKLFRKTNLHMTSESFDDKISACVFGQGKDYLAVGLTNGKIELLSLRDLSREKIIKKHEKAVVMLQFGRNDKILMACDEDAVSIWNVNSGIMLLLQDSHTETISKCLLFDDGKRLASTSYDGFFKVWDIDSNKETFSFKIKDSAMMSCAVSKDNSMMASCAADNKCHIWSTDGKLLHELTDDDVIRTIEFSPNNKYIAMGADNGSVKVWDLKNGKLKCECKGHDLWITDIHFHEDSSIIVTASENLKFFNLKGDRLQTIPLLGSYLSSVKSSNNLGICITIDSLGYLYILDKL